MTGHLHLVCAPDAAGRSRLKEQSFRAPVHISKPHWDAETLVVNVVNPTAGLLAGDAIECQVRVETGARLVLTSPSASRAHRMKSGEAALVQRFSVAAGGFLEVLPELFIPQAGTRYRQATEVEVGEGGELIFFETLAPGRVASGEVFRFASLDWTTDVRYGGAGIVRERYRLRPDDESLAGLRAAFPAGYYASCFAIGPRFMELDAFDVSEVHGEEVWIGASRLVQGGWAIKALARDSLALRRVLRWLRHRLYAAKGEAEPALRRV